jgi:hypothetical protein
VEQISALQKGLIKKIILKTSVKQSKITIVLGTFYLDFCQRDGEYK